MPPAPAGWLITTARNRVIDRLRREGSRDARQAAAVELLVREPRAVAVAEVHGAARALEVVDGLELSAYHLFHAVRADLLRRLGRDADAAAAYLEAMNKCENGREKAFLEKRYREMEKRKN